MPFDREKFCRDALDLARRDVRFRHMGEDPATGLDCINVPKYLVELQGHKLPFEFGVYYESAPIVPFIEKCDRYLTRIGEGEARKSDLYAFSIKRRAHIGVRVTDDEPDPLLVHAFAAPVNKIVTRPLDEHYRRLVIAVYRIPDEFSEEVR